MKRNGYEKIYKKEPHEIARIKRWTTLIKLIKENNYKSYAEIGVMRGRCFFEIAAALPHLNMIAVDIWEQSEFYSYWSEEQVASMEAEFDEKAANLKTCTKLKETSISAASGLKDSSLDIAFIDADHTYEAVVADILAWKPKIRPGGILCGHDYRNMYESVDRFPGVTQAIDETFPKNIETADDSMWIKRL